MVFMTGRPAAPRAWFWGDFEMWFWNVILKCDSGVILHQRWWVFVLKMMNLVLMLCFKWWILYCRCTEIELLVKQSDIPEVPLYCSAELHIEAAARVQVRQKWFLCYKWWILHWKGWNLYLKWWILQAGLDSVAQYCELQYKCQGFVESSIENAEIMENCPWEMMILYWKMADSFAIRGTCRRRMSTLAVRRGCGGRMVKLGWAPACTVGRKQLDCRSICVRTSASLGI